MKPNLSTVRQIVQELRSVVPSDRALKNNIMVDYVLKQARAHRETSEVLCKEREELKHLAETYRCYLTSQRLYNDIKTNYTGKGERSIKETADLVGFKLPHDPK